MHHDPNIDAAPAVRLTAVVRRASFRVAEGLVGERGRAKTVGGRCVVGMHVRMGRAGGAPIGAIDVGRRCEATEAEYRIVIGGM